MDEFYDKVPIDGEIILDCPDTDSIVVSTPFDGKPTYFYYNMKTNGFPAYGEILFNKQKVIFDKEDSFGVLNWGRGVFPYKSKWYWGTASGLLNGVPFGFNIGNGAGNTSAATENMLFYDRIGHKLSEVDFYIPEKKAKMPKMISK